MNTKQKIQRSAFYPGVTVNSATHPSRSKFEVGGSLFDVELNGQSHGDRFRAIDLTPALSHSMSEGDRIARIEFQRSDFKTRVERSPSLIEWERARVSVSVLPTHSEFKPRSASLLKGSRHE